MKIRYLLIFVCAPLLFLVGCVNFDVHNISELNARVLIRTPDSSKGYTKFIRPMGVGSSFSNYGGSYTITVLPDEAYRELLLEMRENISARLFGEGANLAAEDVARLVQNMKDIQVQLDRLAEEGASCSGTAPDFSSVMATLSWSASESNWNLYCSVESDSD